MKNEHLIASQVLEAQTDRQAADRLIEQYLPFIKAETAKSLGRFPTDGDDELSIAMFAFYEAVMAYRQGKGSFLKLAALTIKNRLIDHHRRERRHQGHLSLDMPDSEEDDVTLGNRIAASGWSAESSNERSAAQQEIQHYTHQLASFSIALTDVAQNCPKQDRTLNACMKALDYARRNPQLLDQLISSKKLPIASLSQGSGVELKTLERHRKYMVAILLAYTNGFDIIRGHLRLIKRKEGMLL